MRLMFLARGKPFSSLVINHKTSAILYSTSRWITVSTKPVACLKAGTQKSLQVICSSRQVNCDSYTPALYTLKWYFHTVREFEQTRVDKRFACIACDNMSNEIDCNDMGEVKYCHSGEICQSEIRQITLTKVIHACFISLVLLNTASEPFGQTNPIRVTSRYINLRNIFALRS